MYQYNQFVDLMFELGHGIPVLSDRKDSIVCKYFIELKKLHQSCFSIHACQINYVVFSKYTT